jgi:hypothetical protein
MIRASEDIARTRSPLDEQDSVDAPPAGGGAPERNRVLPDPRRALPRRRLTASVLVGIFATLMTLGAAPAGAAPEIERIWSFNGGEVAIHHLAGGKFEGVVVTPTTFDECPHQAGEKMWTNMTPQPDGSFWGFHQWLFERSCVANPEPGPTAWRVLSGSGGALSLEVCFSEPGRSQPTIAPSGASTGASFGCKTSAPTGLLPVVTNGSHAGNTPAGAEQISFARTIVLPSSRSCVRRGTLQIKLRDPKHDPIKEVVVRVKRHTIADIRGVQRLHRAIVLRGLPSGPYTLKITATTVLDQKLSGKRRFHSCKRRGRRGKTRLHRTRRG